MLKLDVGRELNTCTFHIIFPLRIAQTVILYKTKWVTIIFGICMRMYEKVPKAFKTK